MSKSPWKTFRLGRCSIDWIFSKTLYRLLLTCSFWTLTSTCGAQLCRFLPSSLSWSLLWLFCHIWIPWFLEIITSTSPLNIFLFNFSFWLRISIVLATCLSLSLLYPHLCMRVWLDVEFWVRNHFLLSNLIVLCFCLHMSYAEIETVEIILFIFA